MTRRRRTVPSSDRGALRVIAGEHAGRRIDAPAGTNSRPTGDRIRESIANALTGRGLLDDTIVLDAFAGSGALGIEALSRGAARVVFADTSPAAIATIRANLDALDLGSRADVRAVDARTALTEERWDLILLDPPYGWSEWDDLLTIAARHLDDGGLIVVESDRPVSAPDGLTVSRTRRHGGTVVTFLKRPGVDE